MSTVDLTGSLKAGLKELREQRKAGRERFEATDADISFKEKAIEAAIEALRGIRATRNITPVNGARKSVGKERFEKIEAYLRANPNSRQADIARALELNPGSVHAALHQLQEGGRATAGERVKANGTTSRMWHFEDESRELVVHAGEGERKGRRQAQQKAA